MFQNIRDRISVRLNQSSSDKLEHDACLVLDTLLGEDYKMSQSDAVKLSLQTLGIQLGILPNENNIVELWQLTDEERVARRIVSMLKELGIELSEGSQKQIAEKIAVTEFNAFN